MGDSDAIMKQGIGNYKGLMICTRPNDKIQQIFNRPFVSRVEAKDQIGLNPAPKVQMNKPLKRIHFVLSKHKQWLEGFKQQVREKKYIRNQENLDKITKTNKLREQSINSINRRREGHQLDSQDNGQTYNPANNDQFNDYDQTAHQSIPQYNQNDDNIQINPDQLEQILSEPVYAQQKDNTVAQPRPQAVSQKQKAKKEKPSWAKTEKQLEDEELQECDDLLSFANSLDYEKYINDLEVQSMVKAIKERVGELKNNPSMYEEQIQAEKEKYYKKKRDRLDHIDEARSNQGENIYQETKSNASARSKLTMQNIKEQVEKVKTENKDDWDKSTTVQEQKFRSNIEEKLVKQLAEDILKNNKYLRGIHSNNSIKQILIGEAKKHFEDTGAKHSQYF